MIRGENSDNALEKALGPHWVPVIRNVNEEGETYAEPDTLAEALQTLLNYPNDEVVIKLRSSQKKTRKQCNKPHCAQFAPRHDTDGKTF